MSDPEGFLQENQGPNQDYLEDLVGGPKPMEHAGELGGFASGHTVEIDDRSTGESPVNVTMGAPSSSQESSQQDQDVEQSPNPGGSGNGQLPGQSGKVT
jgi:hypothetical protein